jgi:hypothetical protein
MRRLWMSLAFGGLGLVGPIVRLMFWWSVGREGALENFLYDFVHLLWPLQGWGYFGDGSRVDWASSIGLSVVLFLILGVLTVSFAKRSSSILVAYLAVCLGVSGLSGLGSGFNADSFVGNLHWLSLVIALAIYWIPFGLLIRKSRNTPSVALT